MPVDPASHGVDLPLVHSDQPKTVRECIAHAIETHDQRHLAIDKALFILDTLRQNGYHLVSTPEWEDRPASEMDWRDARVLALKVQVDDQVLEASHTVHRNASLDDKNFNDYIDKNLKQVLLNQVVELLVPEHDEREFNGPTWI